jgi:hypothetical protein
METLYALINTSRNELVDSLAVYAIAATKPYRGKAPKQAEWTLDTTLLWTNFTLRFRSDWTTRFTEVLSTTQDVEGRGVLKEQAKLAKQDGGEKPGPEEKDDDKE